MHESALMPPESEHREISWLKALLPIVVVGLCGLGSYFLLGHLSRAEYGSSLGYVVLGFFGFFSVLYISVTREIKSLDDKSAAVIEQIETRLIESQQLYEHGEKLALKAEEKEKAETASRPTRQE